MFGERVVGHNVQLNVMEDINLEVFDVSVNLQIKKSMTGTVLKKSQ